MPFKPAKDPRCPMKRFALTTIALTMAWSTQATAITKTFKYDEFSTSIYSAADEISTQGLSVQAAYGKGEAFGQIYRPEAGEYPVTIQGVDFFFAGPPNAETVLKSTAVREVIPKVLESLHSQLWDQIQL